MPNKVAKVIDDVISMLSYIKDNLPDDVTDDWEDFKREEQFSDANYERRKAEQAKPKYTLEDVRKPLVELAQNGKSAQVKELLAKFGASKLSEVAEEDYAELLGLVGVANGS